MALLQPAVVEQGWQFGKGGKAFAPWAGGKGKPGRRFDAWGGEYVDGGYIDCVGTFWPCAHVYTEHEIQASILSTSMYVEDFVNKHSMCNWKL